MADEASFDRAKAKAFTMLMVRHLEGAAVSIMLEVGRRSKENQNRPSPDQNGPSTAAV